MNIDIQTIRKNYSLRQLLAIIETYNKIYEKTEKAASVSSYRRKYRQNLSVLRKAKGMRQNKGILRKKIK